MSQGDIRGSSLEGATFNPERAAGVMAEYEGARGGWGLADLSAVGRLELTGADRVRFLNAYVTCDVKGLAAGQGVYGFVTSAQGRILADLTVLALADRLWLVLPPEQQDAIAAHLRKFVIADRVEIGPLAGTAVMGLIGPEAAAVLERALDGGVSAEALTGLPEWGHLRGEMAGGEVLVERAGRFGVPAFRLWVPAAAAAAVTSAVLAIPRARRVGAEALELLRIEAGLPRFGRDFGPQNFPQETGADEAVSYTKGCYLGQEVVARIHYRGGVQKLLRGLVFAGGVEVAGGPPPVAGTALLFEGREAGVVGSAAFSPALGMPIGLGIVHRRAAEPGTRLEIAGGGVAEVRELPFLQRVAPDG